MKLFSIWIVFAAGLIGCTSPNPVKDNEEQVKKAFTALQSAIKAKDAVKIWDLLDKDSQSDAEREAKAVKDAYGKLADKYKADYEKRLNLTGTELAEMTGKLYVKSAVFYGKHHEIPDSTIDKISVTGESGTVNSIEDDGDKVNFPVARDKGHWKFSLPIPKAPEK